MKERYIFICLSQSQSLLQFSVGLEGKLLNMRHLPELLHLEREEKVNLV